MSETIQQYKSEEEQQASEKYNSSQNAFKAPAPGAEVRNKIVASIKSNTMHSKYSTIQLVSLFFTLVFGALYINSLISDNFGAQIGLSIIILYIVGPIDLLFFAFSLDSKSKNAGRIILFEIVLYILLLTNIYFR